MKMMRRFIRRSNWMFKHKLGNEGFTLVELMMSMAIFAMLMLVIYATFFTQIQRFGNDNIRIAMSMDANRGLRVVQETIDTYDNIVIAGNKTVASNGVILIDSQDDGVNNGLILNVSNGKLFDASGTILCENIEDITFTQGPNDTKKVPIMTNVVLVEIVLRNNDAAYFLEGGVNLAR